MRCLQPCLLAFLLPGGMLQDLQISLVRLQIAFDTDFTAATAIVIFSFLRFKYYQTDLCDFFMFVLLLFGVVSDFLQFLVVT
uniref:Uncharacterized protein n=1 Tax=Anopheles darlingi TaxID=43151 RepID=A0A2M4D0T8_ANODA